jgi:hypothetical protein
MGCTLTNGYSLGDCVVSNGGVYTVYIAGHEKNTAFSKITGTNIVNGYDGTSITYSFQQFEQDVEIAESSESLVVSRENGTRFYEQSVTLTLHYSDSTTANDTLRDTLEELSRGNMLLIVKENSGIHRLYGAENGLRVTTGDGGSGKAFGDLNGITLTLTGKESESAPIVDPADTSQVAPDVSFGI